MYKKILLAYNGTRQGRTALFECTEVTSLGEAQMHLLAVAIPPPMPFVEGFDGVMLDPESDSERKHMESVLAEGLATLEQRGYAVTGHFAVGEPVQEICRIAQELQCDLIVVGHQQKRPFLERWWRGSVSANLLDHAPCSILIAITRADYARASGSPIGEHLSPK